MIIRRYVVRDLREALVRAKYELGKEAIIISQKEVRPGPWYKLFRKKKLEVTVAIEGEIHERNLVEQERLSRRIEERQKKASVHVKSPTTIYPERGVRRVFGEDTTSLSRWSQYCQDKGIPEDTVEYANLKSFVEECYMDNAFVKEMKLGRINVFVGPTGVGKTTTIAKIASRAFLHEDKKVGLITIDTYRIAAVEQLRKYARILGIPCETANDPAEMARKVKRLKECDIILVDTVGASPKNEERIEDIRSFMEVLPQDRTTFLTLSMSVDVDTNNDVLKTYKMLDYHSIILTKFDEVRNYRNFWNMIENNVLPVQYFCYGQNVPEDIQESSLDNVLSYLWRELKYD